MEDIFSSFPQLRARFEDMEGNIREELNTRILFQNILSVYGMMDAVAFVDVLLIAKDGRISILKDKPKKVEDDVHPIDLVSLFVRLLKENVGCGIDVFDDMIEIELSEFVTKLMKKYHIKPMREGPHGKQEDF
jgi:hypothetical protein